MLRDTPQKVQLMAADIELVTWTRTIGTREGYPWETRLGLGVSKAIRALKREVYIKADPINIGELINFRIGPESTGFPQSWTLEQDRITPCFTTYNIEVTHELRYSIRGNIEGQKFVVDGKQPVLILKPPGGFSDDVPRRDDWLPEEDESWIVPPLE